MLTSWMPQSGQPSMHRISWRSGPLLLGPMLEKPFALTVAAYIRPWNFCSLVWRAVTEMPHLLRPAVVLAPMLQRPLSGSINTLKNAGGLRSACLPLSLRHRRTRSTQSHPVRPLPPFPSHLRHRVETSAGPPLQLSCQACPLLRREANNPLPPMRCVPTMQRVSAPLRFRLPRSGQGRELVRTRSMVRWLLLHHKHTSGLLRPQRLRRLRDHGRLLHPHASPCHLLFPRLALAAAQPLVTRQPLRGAPMSRVARLLLGPLLVLAPRRPMAGIP